MRLIITSSLLSLTYFTCVVAEDANSCATDQSLLIAPATEEPVSSEIPTPEDSTSKTPEPAEENSSPSTESETLTNTELNLPEDSTSKTPEPAAEDSSPSTESETLTNTEPNLPEDSTSKTPEPAAEDSSPSTESETLTNTEPNLPEDSTSKTPEPTEEASSPSSEPDTLTNTETNPPEDSTSKTPEPVAEDSSPSPEPETLTNTKTNPPEDSTSKTPEPVAEDSSPVTEPETLTNTETNPPGDSTSKTPEPTEESSSPSSEPDTLDTTISVNEENLQHPTENLASDKKLCSPGPNSRGTIGYRGPKGFGYDHGYTTLSTFVSPSGERTFQPFIDLRGHVFNDGRWAANAGFGGRYDCGPVILGLNAYYDFRDTTQLGGQSQVGGGFELLSEWVDFRVNGYVPFGSTKETECPCFDHFACHSAFVTQVARASLADIDAELGFYVPGLKAVDLYFAIGPYYLFEKSVGNTLHLGGEWGGRARMSLKVYDGITLGGDVTYDPIFNTRGQGWITLSFPFGPANLVQNGSRLKEKYPAPCDDTARHVARMTQPVYRNEIIPVENKTLLYDICHEKGCSTKIYYVCNTHSNRGSGTIKDPFNNLAAAECASCPGDVIYVFSGDGTSRGMDRGLIMKDYQKLIGSSACFELCGVCIPACTPGGSHPLIENNLRTTTVELFDDLLDDVRTNVQAGFGVQMANCTEVAGFCFNGEPQSNAAEASLGVILGRGSSFTIRDSFFTKHTGSAIYRQNTLSRGTVNIANTCITDVSPFVGASSSSSFGVLFMNPVNKSSFTFCNNKVENFSIAIQGNLNDAIIAGIAAFNTTDSNFLCTNSTFKNFSASTLGASSEALLLGINIGSGGGADGINRFVIRNTNICCLNSTFSDFTASTNGLISISSALGIGIGSGVLNESTIANTSVASCNNSFNNFFSGAIGDNGISSAFGIVVGTGNRILENAIITDCNLTCKQTSFSNFNVELVGDAFIAGLPVAGILGLGYGTGNITDGQIVNSPLFCTDSSFKNFTIETNGNNTFGGIFGVGSGDGIGVEMRAKITNSPVTCCNTSFENFSATAQTTGIKSVAGIFGLSNGSGGGTEVTLINSPVTCISCSFNNFNASAQGAGSNVSTSAIIGIASGSGVIPQITASTITNSSLLCKDSTFNNFTVNSTSPSDPISGIFGIIFSPGTLSNGSLLCTGSSFTNFQTTAAGNAAFSTGFFFNSIATESNSFTVCNNFFDQLSASGSTSNIAADMFLVSRGNMNFCTEKNQFFSSFQARAIDGTSCLRLTGNQNQGDYVIQQIGGTWNVESPDLGNLTAGLQSINQGTFTLVEGTPVPVGTCNCTACCR